MFYSQANSLQSNVTVRELQWGTDTDSFGPPFDVIIASDLLYDMRSIPELMLTIVSLSSSDTVTYLAFEVRPHVIRAAFQAMEAYGLKAEEVNFSKGCLGCLGWTQKCRAQFVLDLCTPASDEIYLCPGMLVYLDMP